MTERPTVESILQSIAKEAGSNVDQLPNIPAFLTSILLGVALDTMITGGGQGLEYIKDTGDRFAIATLPLTDKVRQSFNPDALMFIHHNDHKFDEQLELICDTISGLADQNPEITKNFGGDFVPRLIQSIKENPSNFSISVSSTIHGPFEAPGYNLILNSHAGNDESARLAITTDFPSLLAILKNIALREPIPTKYNYSISSGDRYISYKNNQTTFTDYSRTT